MTDSNRDHSSGEASHWNPKWTPYAILAGACALVFGVYVCTAHTSYLASASLNAADSYYNLLTQGFRAGQLNLKKSVPPSFARLADPYDRAANSPYGLLDLSYYNGKFYLYFGVTPALTLFWPYAALTGHYLAQKNAAVIFCLVGFLASASLLWTLWRRYFAEVSVVVVAAGALALGLATFTPYLLARCDVYEVSIACGYAFTMLALVAIWRALHEPRRRGWWSAAASLAYGLAVAARPSLLPGAVVLIVPVVRAWRERREVWVPLLAATVPLALIGLGLMLYNALRFGDPFEFGLRYQLAGDTRSTSRSFGLQYLWFHFRVYFLEPAHWSSRFPFVQDITAPAKPVGHGNVERPFGVLTNVPLVWLALAAPLAWRNRSAEARGMLRGLVAVLVLLFGICALTIGAYFGASLRYEVEFLPALVLLAAIGILSLERTVARSGAGQAGHRTWQRTARWSWWLLLGFSVAFNLLVSIERCAEAHNDLGCVLDNAGRPSEAVAAYEQALQLRPDYAEAHFNLGIALRRIGDMPGAVEHWQQAVQLEPDYAEAYANLGNAVVELGELQHGMELIDRALRLKPDFADAHNNRAYALILMGRLDDAVGECKRALELKPALPEAHANLRYIFRSQGKTNELIQYYESVAQTTPQSAVAHGNLGDVLLEATRVPEAIAQYEQALRIDPDFPQVLNNLGAALGRSGRTQEAVAYFERALRIEPDIARTHNNLGAALMRLGRVSEAIAHYEQALRINPSDAQLHFNLAVALEPAGREPEAIAHYEQALRINPDHAEAHYNLGSALAQGGRLNEAIEHWEQAVRLRPDYADAHYNLGSALAEQDRVQEAIGQYELALRFKPDFAVAHNDLGILLSRIGNCPEAIRHWEQALRIQPDFAEAHYHLGAALEEDGRLRDAAAHYEQAVQISPDYPEAQSRLARLREAP
jgi:tetratricopeptide (TPR) repeat protein